MLTDRHGLALSTVSAAARDAYVQASDLALTFYPGAAEAYDRAIAADPGFALAHAGKAQVLMRQGDVAAARAALAATKEAATGMSEREASHIKFFDLVFAGRTDAAIPALYAHLGVSCPDRSCSRCARRSAKHGPFLARAGGSAYHRNGKTPSSGRIGFLEHVGVQWKFAPKEPDML
jgi:hypothetical protein